MSFDLPQRSINGVARPRWSLRGRLLILWAISLVSAVAAGTMLVQLYRQSSIDQVARAEAVTDRACDEIASRFRFYTTGLTRPPADLRDEKLRQGLLAVVFVALAHSPGVEGGIWQRAEGSLAYAFPTYEGTGPKTDLPQAEAERIRAINAEALAEDRRLAASTGAAMRMARGGQSSQTPMGNPSQEHWMHDAPHRSGPRRVISAALGAVLLLGLALGLGLAAAQDALPRPPCEDITPFPAYPAPAAALGAAPAVVQAWQAGRGPRWTPPACTGWAAGPGQGFRTLVALAGRIQLAGGADQVLGRFGEISMLRGVRYWSTSDGAWRPLVSSASALDGPNPGRRRADFTAAELRSGGNAFFVQHDSRSSADVVYRMRVLESSADRIVIATENVTSVRLMVVTLFQPGALQAVHILQRLSATSWGYYGLSRTTQDGSSSLAGGHEASYVNRAAALYRFIAGVPTDRDPPMAR